MRAPEPSTLARRSGAVPICAVFAVVLVWVGLVSGCLNPMPDDFPSQRGESGPGYQAAPGSGDDDALPDGENPPVELPDPAPQAPPASNAAGAGPGDAGVDGSSGSYDDGSGEAP